MANRRLRRRLRQRWMGRSVLLFLGTQHSFSQQRRRHVHRCHAAKRAFTTNACAGARDAPFSITIATGILICSSAITSSSIRRRPRRRRSGAVPVERHPGHVRSARPDRATPTCFITTMATELLPMCREKAGILKPGPRYSITAVASDFDNDGWPDIYVAVDSEPSILFQQQSRRDIHRYGGDGWMRLQREWARASRHGRWRCRLRLRRLVRHFQDKFCRRHLQSVSQQRRRNVQRCDVCVWNRDQQSIRRMGLRIRRLRQRWLGRHHPGQRARLSGNRRP